MLPCFAAAAIDASQNSCIRCACLRLIPPPTLRCRSKQIDPLGLLLVATCSEAGPMKDIRAEMPMRPDMMWDLLIRLSGIALIILLIVAYSTGEEFPHTHIMIGYAIATVLAAGIFWAIVRPHHDRFPSIVYSPRGIKAQLQNADKVPSAP